MVLTGPSSDTESLQTELEQLTAVVQALQARDQVTLEDPPSIEMVDISYFIIVYQLVEDGESPAATPTYDRRKRQRDEDDELSDELREKTRHRGQSIEKQNVWLATWNSLVKNYPTVVPSGTINTSLSSALAGVTLLPPLPILVPEPVGTVVVSDPAADIVDALEATSSRDEQLF
ncbi:hypothetical protein K7X08_025861 [Anisodus acutangulus]|uniref:Uncharacterized protein n=1 Tax=Anisodus acutangulus TaxID=402998 RepID=A0A9Q1QW17_9SOLA|nr:hypothetical protein K7X08_025861 [Anisodus acutangulus]